MPGGMEILVICGVVVLLFGAGAIPKFARSIGKARKEFEKGVKEGDEKAAVPPSENKEIKESDDQSSLS